MSQLTLKSGRPVKYQVEISPVREVTLVGSADLGYWQERLDRERLTAAEVDGQAQILIATANMKFKGISFRELSISVVVAQAGTDVPRDAAFLLCAFNSVRLFAFVERTFFRTPYYRGRVDLKIDGPPGIVVDDGYGGVLIAGMGEDDFDSRTPASDQYHDWEGPIYLPSLKTNAPGTKLFFAKLGGHTRTYPFAMDGDEVWLHPSKRHPVFQALIDSHFRGREWIVRPKASHAKSKTMPRSAVGIDTITV